VNLIFLAAPSDKVWDGVSGLGLLQSGRDIGRIDNYTLNSGDDFMSYKVGNIQFNVPPESLPLRFNQVKVTYKDGNSQTLPVGAWSLELSTTESLVSAIDEWPAILPDCSPVTTMIKNNDDDDVVVGSTADVSVAPATQRVLFSEETTSVVLTPVCDAEFDLFVFTPNIAVNTSDLEKLEAPLDPVSIGFAPLASETLKRMSARLAD